MSSFGSHKYIIAAPSGTGKTTMAEAMKDLGLNRCITCTTRPPRPEEIMTDAYYFEKSFDGLDLFERAEFGGYEYGISMEDLAAGDFVILEPQGVDFYRKHYPGPLTVISLQCEGIDVDPERRARDEGAGFDRVNPDITVYGETVAAMRENLIAGLITYEMNRRRESGISYLPEYTSSKVSIGTVRLCFTDSEYDLPVTTEITHRAYREPYFDYDGIDSSNTNYETLFNAFQCMTRNGKECSLNFSLKDETLNPLYSCYLSGGAGKVQGALYPEYLLMEPFRFEVNSVKEALNLALGGFIAAQNDALGLPDHDFREPGLAENYRKALSENRFRLNEAQSPIRKITLTDQIRHAEKSSEIHLQKMIDSQFQSFALTENER